MHREGQGTAMSRDRRQADLLRRHRPERPDGLAPRWGLAHRGTFARLRKRSPAILIVGSCWFCALLPVAAQQEKPAEIIAAQIRMQGFPCEDPKRAEQDEKLSKPNQKVWLLRCANAFYRIKLTPDMAAQVERLD